MKLVLAFLLALVSGNALAQQVQQSGSIIPGTVPRWITNGVIGSGGTAANPSITSLGILNNGNSSFCINSAASSASARNQFCLGATTNGGARISSYAFGSATDATITFDINGTVQGFPTVQTLPVTVDDQVCFATTGGELKSCGTAPPPDIGVITPEQFGTTVGDCVADDTTPVAAAVAYLNANGGTLVLSKNYGISSQQVITRSGAYVDFVGNGAFCAIGSATMYPMLQAGSTESALGATFTTTAQANAGAYTVQLNTISTFVVGDIASFTWADPSNPGQSLSFTFEIRGIASTTLTGSHPWPYTVSSATTFTSVRRAASPSRNIIVSGFRGAVGAGRSGTNSLAGAGFRNCIQCNFYNGYTSSLPFGGFVSVQSIGSTVSNWYSKSDGATSAAGASSMESYRDVSLAVVDVSIEKSRYFGYLATASHYGQYATWRIFDRDPAFFGSPSTNFARAFKLSSSSRNSVAGLNITGWTGAGIWLELSSINNQFTNVEVFGMQQALSGATPLQALGMSVGTASNNNTFDTVTITGTPTADSGVDISLGNDTASNMVFAAVYDSINLDSASLTAGNRVSSRNAFQTGTYDARTTAVATNVGAYNIGGKVVVGGTDTVSGGANTAIYNAAATPEPMYVPASDGVNYFRATTQRWQNLAGSAVLAELTSSGFDVYGSSSGRGRIAAQATAGTPTLTLPTASGTFAVSAAAPLALSATTGAITWSGTSGGVPYFSSATTAASSGTLAAGAIVLGGGAGAAPTAASLGAGLTNTGGTIYASASLNGAPPTGRWSNGMMQSISASTTLVVTANTAYAVPFYVNDTTTWTRLAIRVTSASGTICRLGIYNWADGVPTTLVLDAGTVSAAGTGIQAATISQQLTPAMYGVAAVCDGTPTLSAALNNQTNAYATIGLQDSDIGAGAASTQMTRAIGGTTLQDPFGAITYTNANSPLIFMRR